MIDIQDEGEVREGLGAPIRKLLESRTGMATTVRLADGEDLTVYDVSWGRDLGSRWEHVTTNCSPPRDERSIHFFHLSDVTHVIDPETGATLIAQTPASGAT